MQQCLAGAGLQSIPAIGTMPFLSSPYTGLRVQASVRTLLGDTHAGSCTTIGCAKVAIGCTNWIVESHLGNAETLHDHLHTASG
jgi:hypothetical protein